jgi:pimeloyl-ACP methyl ester carboxylesterase
MPLVDHLGALAAWAVTLPSRRPRFRGSALRDVEFRSEDDTPLHGWLSEVPNACGTVVVGHGYRDDCAQMRFLVPTLSALGLRTLLINFRAHGRSGGSRITIGAEEARDVRAALAWAGDLGGLVSYLGYSMGAAAYLLSGVQAHSAVLDSPYDTLASAIDVRGAVMRAPRTLVDAFQRANEARCQLVVDTVRPIDAAATLTRPTLFVFARNDEWVREDVRARYQAQMSATCAYVEVEGGHQGHFGTRWNAHVAGFLNAQAG